MVKALRAVGLEPVTSDKSRGVWHLQTSPLNQGLYELVKPDIVISFVTEEQAGRFWAPLLNRCTATTLILVVACHKLPCGAAGSRKREQRYNGYVLKLLIHDPGQLLRAGAV
jgi:hypothetical protein